MELDHNNIVTSMEADGYVFHVRMELDGITLIVYNELDDGEIEIVNQKKVRYSSIDADTRFFNNVLENT